MNEKKLEAKDLVTTGVFSALFFIFSTIAEMLTGMTPVTYIFSAAVIGLICAPIYFIAMLKVGKPWLSFILLTINAVLWGVLGMFIVMAFMIVFGLITELILRNGGYKSFRRIALAYITAIYGYFFGSVSLMYLFTDRYLEWTASRSDTFAEEYILAYINSAKSYLGIFAVIAVAVLSALGCLLAKRILKKHFKKAGII